MSKYGRLRRDEGHSKWFLTKTLTQHDATMDHPLMKAIYDQSVTTQEYNRWLAGQFYIFRALEEVLDRDVSKNTLLANIYDRALLRVSCAEADLVHHCGTHWAFDDSLSPTPKTLEYLNRLKNDANDGSSLLMCHHFLQYLAVLSGGQYLKRMMNKKWGREADNEIGATFFTFPGLPASQHAAYVQGYCVKLDEMHLEQDELDAMLKCMLATYELILEMFDEIRPRTEAAQAVLLPEKLEMELGDLSMDALHKYDGKDGGRILLAIRGKVYDVTGGSTPARTVAYTVSSPQHRTRL